MTLSTELDAPVALGELFKALDAYAENNGGKMPTQRINNAVKRARHLAAAIITLRKSEDELREKVETAAVIFEEYGRLHRAKLHDGTPTVEWMSAVKKAERNEAYAREMRQALSNTEDRNA